MNISISKPTRERIEHLFRDIQERQDYAIGALLGHIGNKAVNAARERYTYTDRTAALTNSMGYAVERGGQEITLGVSPAPGVSPSADSPTDGVQTGLEQAHKTLNALQASGSSSNDYRLHIVAGMPYARYVEARGYSVLDPARLLAEQEVAKAHSQLTQLMKERKA